MIIYKVTNKVNGKSYIGQTVGSLARRKVTHLSHSKKGNTYFHNTLKKYGIDGFDWSVLHRSDDKEELNKLEIYYIGLYDTYNNGYNLTLGGEKGVLGYKFSRKQIRVLSESHKGISTGPRSDKAKKAIGKANRKNSSKPIVIKNIYLFPSMKMASQALNMKYTSFHSRIRYGNVDYRLWP